MLKITSVEREGDEAVITFEGRCSVDAFRDQDGNRLSRAEIVQKIKQWLITHLGGG